MSGALDQRCKVPRRFAEFAGRDVLVERRQRVGDSRRAAGGGQGRRVLGGRQIPVDDVAAKDLACGGGEVGERPGGGASELVGPVLVSGRGEDRRGRCGEVTARGGLRIGTV